MPLTRRQTKCKKSQTAVESSTLPKPNKKVIEKRLKLSKKLLRSRIRERCLRNRNSKLAKIQTIKFQQIQELSRSQNLNCPICLERFVHPTVTQCGHIFCLSCAQQSLKHRATCSLCRSDISLQDFKPQKLLQQLLELKLKKEADQQAIDNYNRRVNEFELEESKRKVDSEIKTGDFVDYWNDRRWKGGQVIDVLMSSKGEKFIKVQSQKFHSQSKIYQFSLNSRLIAKHRTFSRESDLFRCFPQIRIDIFDISEAVNPVFWNEPMIGRGIFAGQPAVRIPFRRTGTMQATQRPSENRINLNEDDDSESLIRFTFSFERPQN